MKMPFGAYKDIDLEDVPTDYIEWVLENLSINPNLQKNLEDQLVWRAGKGVEVKKDE